ncbi:hypothetical protein A2856_00135 [Candidatus Uhrbacteria bacterium RIFCSPHIGHO2_01_FULL_63_20]|uniref:Uncharacterized protein n=1 Tax=Candidatus Uhrbacteria bacterium RIFCSPHIGHO2_01_FULL_63_20 TaxID=1802385 RepID=A0A1F7TLP9_9BACT|nr:MAG: hypothetical protein A2856_00135 [Candidatus Uhrbacteria bacterium RIFCSPHIGHO2_01_FULL_63_20]
MAQGVKTYADLPDEVVEFLGDLPGFEFAGDYATRHGINDPQLVSNLVDAVVLGSVALADLPLALKNIGVSEDKAKAAASELALHRLLPVAGVVGDVAGQVSLWGGDVGAVKGETKVVLPQVTAEAFVSGFLAERKAQLPSDVLQKRLEFVLVSFVKGVRDQSEAAMMMSRPSKVGGLDMNEMEAMGLVSALADRLAFVKLSFGEEKGDKGDKGEKGLKGEGQSAAKPAVPPPLLPLLPLLPLQPLKPVPSPAPKPAPRVPPPTPAVPPHTPPNLGGGSAPRLAPPPKPVPKPIAGKVVDAPTDEDEQEAVGIASKKNIPPAGTGAILEPGQIAASVAQTVGLTFASPDLQKRFALAVDARVRDVRDAFETRALLEQPVEKGGLGVTGAKLANVVEALEKLVSRRQDALDLGASKDRKAFVAKEADERRQREITRRKDEDAALAKRYAEITGQADASVPSVGPDAMRAASVARMSASTVPSAPGRPRVEDVRFAQRLAGPVDELRVMTLADFRRLGKDPADAARKVRAKVALLEDQGYDQKIAAVKAWRESPVNRLYVTLSQEALATGKSITQVAEERRRSDPGLFTSEELAVIPKLNAELRF